MSEQVLKPQKKRTKEREHGRVALHRAGTLCHRENEQANDRPGQPSPTDKVVGRRDPPRGRLWHVQKQ